ncbi:MAG: aldehyde dehydrogenase family protein, partial [Gemmatimonadetes bacterium]|nr:aldehyde dehydrogenase family protein [Gemmatimonadota bacterium]
MLKSRYAADIPGWQPKHPDILPVTSPYSGEAVAEVALVDASGLDRALDVATQVHAAYPQGLPAHERSAILKRLAALVTDHHEDLAMLIASEGGKPLVDARIEVTRAANTVELSAEEATRIAGGEVPMQGTPAAMGRLAFTIREPIGVVAAVSAFNHPVNLIAHQ